VKLGYYNPHDNHVLPLAAGIHIYPIILYLQLVQSEESTIKYSYKISTRSISWSYELNSKKISLLAEALSFVIPDEKIESLSRFETLCLKCRRPPLWTNKTSLYLKYRGRGFESYQGQLIFFLLFFLSVYIWFDWK